MIGTFFMKDLNEEKIKETNQLSLKHNKNMFISLF